MPQVRIDRRLLADTDLPRLCIRCGAPATAITTRIVTVPDTFSRTPRRLCIQAPFCRWHRRHWFYRKCLIWGTLMLLVVGGATGLYILDNTPHELKNETGILCCGFDLLLLGWTVFSLAIELTSIRVLEGSDAEIVITGVSETFARAIAKATSDRVRSLLSGSPTHLDDHVPVSQHT